MNREIKFRAWDPINKKFSFVGFDILGEVTVFDICREYELEYALKLKITQFTGLKDKNGRDIYEGDILKEPESTFYLFIGTGVVEYEPDYGGFIVRGKYSRHQHHENLTCDVAIDCEIIGNIFETPELLNNER